MVGRMKFTSQNHPNRLNDRQTRQNTNIKQIKHNKTSQNTTQLLCFREPTQQTHVMYLGMPKSAQQTHNKQPCVHRANHIFVFLYLFAMFVRGTSRRARGMSGTQISTMCLYALC